MANSNAPTGLNPVRYMSGAPYNGACNVYFCPATDATALFVGDPVIKAGSADTDGVSTITAASVGGKITGVVVGVRPSPTITTRYRPASTACYVLVADDPNLLFEVQEDAVGGALAAVDVGLNADIIIAAGSTTTGFSAVQLDTSTKATTNTLALSIKGFVQRADNVIGANAKVLVGINLPSETGAAGSTGV